MIDSNIFGVGLDDNLDLNTAEALGFTTHPAEVNVYIIPDEDTSLSFLKNKTLAVA